MSTLERYLILTTCCIVIGVFVLVVMVAFTR